jgi:hypothetical protein
MAQSDAYDFDSPLSLRLLDAATVPGSSCCARLALDHRVVAPPR